MTDLTRIISISSLFFLSLFCFQAEIFLCSGHKLKKNGRRTLVFIEFFTGLMLLFDALAYSYRGNTSSAGYYMVRISNFFYMQFLNFFFCLLLCLRIHKTIAPKFFSPAKTKILHKKWHSHSTFYSHLFLPCRNQFYGRQPVHGFLLFF